MLRIDDISKKKEEQKLVIDKESSARIIKRSLWQGIISKGVQRKDNKEEEETKNIKKRYTINN
jgi:hypothetical protein